MTRKRLATGGFNAPPENEKPMVGEVTVTQLPMSSPSVLASDTPRTMPGSFATSVGFSQRSGSTLLGSSSSSGKTLEYPPSGSIAPSGAPGGGGATASSG